MLLLGIDTIPFVEGSAGGDKVVDGIFSRLAKKGYNITAYNRVYNDKVPKNVLLQGYKIDTLQNLSIRKVLTAYTIH